MWSVGAFGSSAATGKRPPGKGLIAWWPGAGTSGQGGKGIDDSGALAYNRVEPHEDWGIEGRAFLMNLPQRVVLTVGLLLIALSFVFPWSQWRETYREYKAELSDLEWRTAWAKWSLAHSIPPARSADGRIDWSQVFERDDAFKNSEELRDAHFTERTRTRTGALFFAIERDYKSLEHSWIAMQVLALGALTASGYFVAGHRSAGVDRPSEHSGTTSEETGL